MPRHIQIMKILNQIRNEINNYINGTVSVRGVSFSTYETLQKIERFANCQYKTGNIDSLGNIKYWFDISLPAIMAEQKNIDFDTKDIRIESEGIDDFLRETIVNLQLEKWMNDNKEGVRINSVISKFSGWGNVIFKKTRDGKFYQTLPLIDTYVINQLAETISGKNPDSAVIERHILTQSDMRAMKGIWNDNLETAIKELGGKGFMTGEGSGSIENTDSNFYEVYERNGEVCLADLKEAREEEAKEGDEEKYVLAKIVCILNKNSNVADSVLFADVISEMPYKEAHRGNYEDCWLRKGIYQILFDIQINANELGNQIARALEFGGHQIFNIEGKTVYQNILTDLKRGDIIEGKVGRIDMAANDINNYINSWNMLMALRDKLTNNSEIVQGNTPAGMPFKLGNLLNENSGKYYDLLRENLSMALESVYADYVIPELMKEFKAVDAVKITGDAKIMNRYFKMRVDNWYIQNLWKFPPHNEEMGKAIKEKALAELMTKKEEVMKIDKDFWKDFKARAKVVISGENSRKGVIMETLAQFIELETDPVRRSALIDKAYRKAGIDISDLPTAQPQPVNPINQPINQPA